MRYLLFAGISYLCGVASISYMFWFLEFEPLISQHAFSTTTAIQNTFLFLLFPLQHSLMARASIKEKIQRVVPPLMERPLYVIASAIVLAVSLLCWKPFGPTIFELSPALPFDIIFFAAVALILWTSIVMDQTLLFGWKNGIAAYKGVSLPDLPLKTDGPFRWIRHPLTSFLIIAIWSHETLSASRLLLNILLTLYSLAGVFFEERDLRKKYGESYEKYCREVPAFIPLLRPGRAGKSSR